MGRIKIVPGSAAKRVCPYCGGGSNPERKTFKPYVDTESGVLLPDAFGICDRDSCDAGDKGKFPNRNELHQFYKSQEDPTMDKFTSNAVVIKDQVVVEYKRHPKLYFNRTDYASVTKQITEGHPFVAFLSNASRPSIEMVMHHLWLYGIRVLSNRGSVCFPYVDPDKVIHDIQCMSYGLDGKRRRDVYPFWLYRIKAVKDLKGIEWVDGYKQISPKIRTFFGAHLLNNNVSKVVHDYICIVEGCKTALLCSLCFPNILFLASFNKHISPKHMDSIHDHIGNRKVFLLPDKGQYDSWQKKWGDQFTVLNFMEDTDYNDIADYIVDDYPGAAHYILSLIR